MLSVFLIGAGYALSAISFWRYRVTQRKNMRNGGIIVAIVASALLVATIAGPIDLVM